MYQIYYDNKVIPQEKQVSVKLLFFFEDFIYLF